MRFLIPYLLIFMIFGCGSSSNPVSKMFVSAQNKDRIPVLMQSARLDYDQGRFEEALSTTEKIIEINSDNEEAALLMGYIYLAKAGLEPFTLTSKLIKKNEANQTKAALNLATTTAASALSDFTDLINISDADFEQMGTLNDSTNQFFTGLDIYLPNKPGSIADSDSPRSKVSTLFYLNKAIKAICPFVNRDIFKSVNDARYETDACPKSAQTSKQPAQAHFLFALSHLIEAIAFNAVLLYQGSSSASSSSASTGLSSNLLKRADKLNQSTFTNNEIIPYLDAVTEIKTDVESVFDTTEESMLYATLVDLRVVVGSFKNIEGIPTSVTSQIEKGLNSLEEAASKAGKAKDDVTSQSSALKEQMNGQVVQTLNTSIAAFIKDQNLDTANLSAEDQEKLDKVCDSFKEIAGDAATLPTGCD